MQVPGGWLATKFGGKYVFGIGIVMTAVLTLLTPLAAQVSVWALVVLRVLEGMFEVLYIYIHHNVNAVHTAIITLIPFRNQNVGCHLSSCSCSLGEMGTIR